MAVAVFRATSPAMNLAVALYVAQWLGIPIGPGQSAQMAVRIREPSANVVAFSFDFR